MMSCYVVDYGGELSMGVMYSKINGYRKDIDGLRALAVVAVIAFHFGFLPNGFLGVDIFFVISGYLITGIVYREVVEDRFSIINFYLRRARRILPLTLLVALVAFLVGIFVMLPDDFENLAQSIVATNLFGNNILQAITTKDYWDVVNEFKPLMHTWSLGIEEQYYVVYPLLLLLIGKHHKKVLLPTLSMLGFLSLLIYFLPCDEYEKFYYLHFRFFELAVGGIAALYLKGRVIVHNYSVFFIVSLIMVLLCGQQLLPQYIALPLTTLLTVAVLATHNEKSFVSSLILQNRLSIAIGLISFSLYMWHQVVLAYARYAFVQHPEPVHMLLILLVIILLSLCSYYGVEQPFRNKQRVKTSVLLSVLALLFLVTTLPSLYVYMKGGVVRDVPELGIRASDAVRGIHAQYNARIQEYKRPFSGDETKVNVLVVGDSFARDWSNVLLESDYSHIIDLCYVSHPFQDVTFQSRVKGADVIFYSRATREEVDQLGIETSKLFVVGTKNFGMNSGYFYNYSGEGYFQQRTVIAGEWLTDNEKLRREWGDRYIDLIARVSDENATVPVFTDDKMFISQDCEHFTQAGARYFARLYRDMLNRIFARSQSEGGNSELF
jgi:peptidoglycan/LPS O-acetylase OafA/YrhL